MWWNSPIRTLKPSPVTTFLASLVGFQTLPFRFLRSLVSFTFSHSDLKFMLINLYNPFLFLHFRWFPHHKTRSFHSNLANTSEFSFYHCPEIHYYIHNLTKLVVIFIDYIIIQFVVGKKNLKFTIWLLRKNCGGWGSIFIFFLWLFWDLYHLQNENGGCSKTFFSSSYVCFVRRSNSRSWCFQYSSFYFLLWRVAITYQDQCLLCIYICVCVCLMLLYTDIVYNQWEKQCECLQMTSKTGFWLSKSSFVPVV